MNFAPSDLLLQGVRGEDSTSILFETSNPLFNNINIFIWAETGGNPHGFLWNSYLQLVTQTTVRISLDDDSIIAFGLGEPVSTQFSNRSTPDTKN